MVGGWGHIIEMNRKLKYDRARKNTRGNRLKKQRESLVGTQENSYAAPKKEVDPDVLSKVKSQIDKDASRELRNRYLKLLLVLGIIAGIILGIAYF